MKPEVKIKDIKLYGLRIAGTVTTDHHKLKNAKGRGIMTSEIVKFATENTVYVIEKEKYP